MGSRNAFTRVTDNTRRRVSRLRFRHRRGAKATARGRAKARSARAAVPRLVDAFGGIDMALGESWFIPRGRK
jgi:hypothetical protein